MRSILSAVLLAGVVLLGGCLTVPLGDPEKAKMDGSYLGFWVSSRPSGDDGKLMVVQAFDARTYLVTQYSFKQTANGVEPNGGKLTFKTWLTPIEKATFATLERMDAGRLLEKDGKPFAVTRITLEGSILTSRPVQPSFVEENGVKTSEDLQKLITNHLENEKMYLDSEVYEKLVAERFSEAKEILAAFGEQYE